MSLSVLHQRLVRRRWLLPVAVLVADAVLLFGAVLVGLQIPGVRSALLPRTASPEYADLHGAVQPLRPGFVSAVLGNAQSSDRGDAGSAVEPTAPESLVRLLGGGVTSPADRVVVAVRDNDDFRSAAAIADVPWAGRADTSSATRQAGEPGGCDPVGGTVWFRYDAPADERLRASTSAGSSTALAAYEGPDLTDLRELGCKVAATGNPSLVLTTQRGHRYYFQVDRAAGGPVVFHLDPQPSLTLASVGDRGQFACGDSDNATGCSSHGSQSASLSADGHYVVFQSDIALVVDRPHETCTGQNCTDVYVRDVRSGRTILVSVSSKGAPGNDSSVLGGLGPYGISADGRFVTFSSLASNLVPGDTNRCDTSWLEYDKASTDYSCMDVFVHDLRTGRTERVSVSSSGQQGNAASLHSAISPDGRYVAFISFASNLTRDPVTQCATTDYTAQGEFPGPPPGVCPGVFLHDRRTGRTERIDVNSAGQVASPATPGGRTTEMGIAWARLAVSSGGRYVAFVSAAGNLASGDANFPGSKAAVGNAVGRDVFVRDRLRRTTTLVSVDSDGHQLGGWAPALTPDGRYVTFSAEVAPPCTSNPVANYCAGVFVRDLRQRTTRRVDVGQDGGRSNDFSNWGSATPDGRYVVFYSMASNLTDDDTNAPIDLQCDQSVILIIARPGIECTPADVFIRDMSKPPGAPGAMVCVSRTPDGQVPHGASWMAAITPDARYVAFESWARVTPADTNPYGDVYLYDRGAS